jgi:hypothetical protein
VPFQVPRLTPIVMPLSGSIFVRVAVTLPRELTEN